MFVEDAKKRVSSFVFPQEKDQEEVYELSTNIWNNLHRSPPEKLTSPRLSRVSSDQIPDLIPGTPKTIQEAMDQGLPTEEDWNLMLQIAQEQVFQTDEPIISEGEVTQRLYQIISGNVRIERSIIPAQNEDVEYTGKGSIRDKGTKYLTLL